MKRTLKNSCPPIFYCAGDLSLFDKRYIGFVGARNVTDDDVEFTTETIRKTVSHGYGVVSGGAKGVDTISEKTALELGSTVMEFLSDSMTRKLRKSEISKAARDGKLLLISVAKPDAGFNTGIAMMRNRYIYAQSSGTVIVHADFEKGGTWAGATDNLKHNWCKELCWDKKAYRGNQALIEKGAIPINSDWDGNVDGVEVKPVGRIGEQLSLF